MAVSQKKTDDHQKPATVLERMGGEPKHVVHAGKKASSRAERKARLRTKARSTRQG